MYAPHNTVELSVNADRSFSGIERVQAHRAPLLGVEPCMFSRNKTRQKPVFIVNLHAKLSTAATMYKAYS